MASPSQRPPRQGRNRSGGVGGGGGKRRWFNLTIENVHPSGSGGYTCVAQNEGGMAEGNVTVVYSETVATYLDKTDVSNLVIFGAVVSGAGFTLLATALVCLVVAVRRKRRRHRRRDRRRESGGTPVSTVAMVVKDGAGGEDRYARQQHVVVAANGSSGALKNGKPALFDQGAMEMNTFAKAEPTGEEKATLLIRQQRLSSDEQEDDSGHGSSSTTAAKAACCTDGGGGGGGSGGGEESAANSQSLPSSSCSPSKPPPQQQPQLQGVLASSPSICPTSSSIDGASTISAASSSSSSFALARMRNRGGDAANAHFAANPQAAAAPPSFFPQQPDQDRYLHQMHHHQQLRLNGGGPSLMDRMWGCYNDSAGSRTLLVGNGTAGSSATSSANTSFETVVFGGTAAEHPGHGGDFSGAAAVGCTLPRNGGRLLFSSRVNRPAAAPPVGGPHPSADQFTPLCGPLDFYTLSSATSTPTRHLRQRMMFPSRPPPSSSAAAAAGEVDADEDSVDLLSKEIEARKELLEALVKDKNDTAV